MSAICLQAQGSNELVIVSFFLIVTGKVYSHRTAYQHRGNVTRLVTAKDREFVRAVVASADIANERPPPGSKYLWHNAISSPNGRYSNSVALSPRLKLYVANSQIPGCAAVHRFDYLQTDPITWIIACMYQMKTRIFFPLHPG